MYIISHKDTSKSLSRLIYSWNIGIAMTISMFLIILVYQVLCLSPVANSKIIKDLVDVLPEFFIKNANLLGFKNYNGSTQIEISIILLAYVLNFVFAIITKRHLTNLYYQILNLEKQNTVQQEMYRVKTLKYLTWIMRLKCIWPVLDFLARFMFIILGFFILVFSIHWKLWVINWIYIVAMWIFYISIPFSLIFKGQDQEFEAYTNINGKTLDIEEAKILKQEEDTKASFRILSQRKVFSALLFVITTVALLLTYLTIPIDELKGKYNEYEEIWNTLIYTTFIFGVNSTENKSGYSFFYQWFGYLAILLLLIIEQKSQLWLKDKFHILEAIEYEKKYKVPETVKQAMFETIKEEKSEIEESFVSNEDWDRNLGLSEESKYSLNYDAEVISNNSRNVSLHFDDDLIFEKIPKIKSKIKATSQDFKNELTKISDDKVFQRKIGKLLNLKYQYKFFKVLSSWILTFIILLLLFSMVFSWNIISVCLLICVGFLVSKTLNFHSLIFINIVIVLWFSTQYGLGVSNLSPKNSPMIFPVPYDDEITRNNLNLPWYNSVYFFKIDSSKWAYYFSLMISYDRVLNLWYFGIILILINIYFTNFYSTIFTEDIEISNDKNIKDIIRRESEILIDISW